MQPSITATRAPATEPASLGRVVHRWRFGGPRARLVDAAWSTALVALVLTALGWSVTHDLGKTARAWAHLWPVAVVFEAIPLAVVLLRPRPRIELELRERGLVAHAPRPCALAWADIERVTVTRAVHDVRGHRRPWSAAIATAGATLTLDERYASHVILSIVEEQTLAPTWNRLRAALAQGRELPFGALWVGAAGLRVGTRAIPWRRIGSIDVDHGELVVRGMDPYVDGELRLWLDEVSHVGLLRELDRVTFAYRYGQSDTLDLGPAPPPPPVAVNRARLPTAVVRPPSRT